MRLLAQQPHMDTWKPKYGKKMGLKQRELHHGHTSPNSGLWWKWNGNHSDVSAPLLPDQMPSRGLNSVQPSAERGLLTWHSEYDLTMSYNRINHYFNWKWWPLGTVTSDNTHGTTSRRAPMRNTGVHRLQGCICDCKEQVIRNHRTLTVPDFEVSQGSQIKGAH